MKQPTSKSKIKVSIYCKGHRQSTAYYRNYQYFDNLPDICPKYRVMMSEGVERRYMPISLQPIHIKVYAYLHTVARMFFALLCDYVNSPDVIVVHRRIVSRLTPLPLRMLLKAICGKGVVLYWDIDDNVKGKELTIGEWELLSRLSTNITVTHSFLRDKISAQYRDKVILLPTTDGDLYKMFTPKVNEHRMESFDTELRMVWVATSVNLIHMEYIAPYLDVAAKKLMEARGKQLVLDVVCDKPLCRDFKFLKLNNIEWTRSVAIQHMLSAHVGIMPLLDNEFTRGKGGFKLVQYQSIGLPSIASDVGFNASVVAPGTGYLIPRDGLEQWAEAIVSLSDKEQWMQASERAYNNWNENFSYKKNLDFWHQQLMNAAKKERGKI